MGRIHVALLLGTTVVAACATSGSTQLGDDELAGEQGDGEQAKADGVDTFGLLTAQLDETPADGPRVLLARANRSTTTCADGTKAAACPVAALDFTELGLATDTLADVEAKLAASGALGPQLIVRGAYVHLADPDAPGADRVTFRVSEVWTAQLGSGSLDGTFVELTDNGLRCFTAPCPSTRESRLNSVRHADTHGLDWSDAFQQAQQGDAASDELRQQVGEAIASGAGAIVVGYRVHGTMQGQPTTLRTVSEVFLRAP